MNSHGNCFPRVVPVLHGTRVPGQGGRRGGEHRAPREAGRQVKRQISVAMWRETGTEGSSFGPQPWKMPERLLHHQRWDVPALWSLMSLSLPSSIVHLLLSLTYWPLPFPQISQAHSSLFIPGDFRLHVDSQASSQSSFSLTASRSPLSSLAAPPMESPGALSVPLCCSSFSSTPEQPPPPGPSGCSQPVRTLLPFFLSTCTQGNLGLASTPETVVAKTTMPLTWPHPIDTFYSLFYWQSLLLLTPGRSLLPQMLWFGELTLSGSSEVFEAVLCCSLGTSHFCCPCKHCWPFRDLSLVLGRSWMSSIGTGLVYSGVQFPDCTRTAFPTPCVHLRQLPTHWRSAGPRTHSCVLRPTFLWVVACTSLGLGYCTWTENYFWSNLIPGHSGFVIHMPDGNFHLDVPLAPQTPYVLNQTHSLSLLFPSFGDLRLVSR